MILQRFAFLIPSISAIHSKVSLHTSLAQVDDFNTSQSFEPYYDSHSLPYSGWNFIGTCLIILIPACTGLIYASCELYDLYSIEMSVQTLDKTAEPGDEQCLTTMFEISKHIAAGSDTFLFQEYIYMLVYMVFASALIGPFIGWATMIAFIIGCATSSVAGWIGMKTATFCNVRTAFGAWNSLDKGFNIALRGGSVVGFFLVSMGVLNLFVLVLIFNIPAVIQAFPHLSNRLTVFEAICGYGLGGSSIALFARVGGGIYTKAADVGADLSGKNEYGLDEDDPRNPAVIADNVGDNVGDVAGMGADLFGSFAESTCAAMVIAANSRGLSQSWAALCFPIAISSTGILTGLVTIQIVRHCVNIGSVDQVERALKIVLALSTVLEIPMVFLLSFLMIPSGTFEIGQGYTLVRWWMIALSVTSGLLSGLAIGFVTEYYTSHSHSPVRQIADSQRVSAATGIIYGLSLGYVSIIIPIITLCLCIMFSHQLAGMYGVSVAAIGMLSTLTMSLTIDVYGPISDNAGGIAEMSNLGSETRARTDALDAAGNTTAAVGKGFAIGSAALVSLALFAAFTVRADIRVVNFMDPFTLIGALYGAMLPFWFSAWTMKSVGEAANDIVRECMSQFPKIIANEAEPDYGRCISLATKVSLREMLWASSIVIFPPIISGTLLGKNFVAGMLIGILLVGVTLAISMSNSGGAWDNSKKYIEAGGLGSDDGKGSVAHKNSVIGDTVGDPLKDTSGPALNILVKLSAMIALTLGSIIRSCSNSDGGPWWLKPSHSPFRVF